MCFAWPPRKREREREAQESLRMQKFVGPCREILKRAPLSQRRRGVAWVEGLSERRIRTGDSDRDVK